MSKVPIGDQIEALDHILGVGGLLTHRDVNRDCLIATVRTLKLFNRFPDAVRAALEGCLANEKIRSDPAIQAVLDVFPDAKMTVRDASE
jgi:hypothetical protein